MKLQNIVEAESHCHGAEAIKEKVVTTVALRAGGITRSPGTMLVLKGSQRFTAWNQRHSFFFFLHTVGSLNFIHLII